MASVSINIVKESGGANSTIMVSGIIDDAAILPITTQLTSLLYSAANSVSATPTV